MVLCNLKFDVLNSVSRHLSLHLEKTHHVSSLPGSPLFGALASAGFGFLSGLQLLVSGKV